MNTEDLTGNFVEALLDMVTLSADAKLEIVELHRDWLICMLDRIANNVEHGSEAFDIVTEAQAVIPPKIYTAAIDRFMRDDATPDAAG